MITFEDTTGYSQRDKERIPRIWTYEFNDFVLIVHRHIHHGDEWLMTLRYRRMALIEGKVLASKQIEDAKLGAIEVARAAINAIREDMAELERALAS